MNIAYRLKKALIARSLERRKRAHPFDAEAAERFALPADADETQINSFYFSGHSIKGQSLLLRFAQRGGGKTEVWFAYRDASGRAYANTRTGWEGEPPAGAKCVEAGRRWAFFFDGEVRSLSDGAVHHARFSGTFEASDAPFDFSYHMDTSVLADAIARQKWSRGFFDELQQNNQVHYEQQGCITGALSVDEQKIEIDLPAMRDHSFGRRDWGYMRRHVWLMALMEDGSALNVNFVDYPKLQLHSGYHTSAQGTRCVKGVSLKQPAYGSMPDSPMYRVTLSDDTQLSVACALEAEFVFPCGEAYTIHEGIGSFSSGGVMGRGVMEFGWNNDVPKGGRA